MFKRIVLASAMFSLALPGMAGAEVLYLFSKAAGDGKGHPSSGVRGLGAGGLVGTTASGGAFDAGSVYELSPPPAAGGMWTEQTLYSFSGSAAAGGYDPQGDLVVGAGGELYGTAGSGGLYNNGAVFRLDPPVAGSSAWTETVLASFDDNVTGAVPIDGLIADARGDLYGTAYQFGPQHGGTVFELTPPAAGQTGWRLTTLHAFGNGDGQQPRGQLAVGPGGNLFGVTQSGPGAGFGTVFELSPPAAGQSGWRLQTLYQFTDVATGETPLAGVVLDRAGALYGTASYGGVAPNEAGVVFKLSPPAVAGGAWRYAVIHAFQFADGADPMARLVFDGAGDLYGTTYGGGVMASGQYCSGGCGTVFKLTPPAGGAGMWSETYFAPPTGNYGAGPQADLLIGGDSYVYGTASTGGPIGSVFKVGQ